MRFLIVILFITFTAVQIGLAQSLRIESVYTDLAKSCRELKSDAESGILYRGRCAGVGGYKIILSESEHHQSINLLTPKDTELELNFLSQNGSVAPSSVGQTIEWRIRQEGKKIKPLALIARLNRFGNPDNRSQATSYLLIIKIKGENACVTDVIEPTVANQNIRARELADLATKKPCRQSALNDEELKIEIQDVVSQADKTFEKSKKSFTIKEKRKNQKFLIEESNYKMKKGEVLTRKFSYSMNKKEIEVVVVHYQIGKFSAEESYYFKNKKLVYATEGHSFRFKGETNSVWSGVFYFHDKKLVYENTNGHGKSETDEWQPETEILWMSRERIRQLTQYLARKK